MQLHEVRTADLSNKKKVRVGRGPGSGLGKTAGRGIKGATSRSGYAMKVTYEGGQMPFFRRLPKRGFRNGPFRVTFSVINVGELSHFSAGSSVSPAEMRSAGLVQGQSRTPVKVLGDGELSVALNVSADAFSKSAIAKIEKAGGKAAWIGGAPKKPSPDFKKIDAEKKAAAKAKAPPPAKKEGGGEASAEAKGGKEGKGAKPAKPESAAEAKAQAKEKEGEGAKGKQSKE